MLMAKAENGWTAQQGKERNEKVVNNGGQRFGDQQEEKPSDYHEEQDSEWDTSYENFVTWWLHVLIFK